MIALLVCYALVGAAFLLFVMPDGSQDMTPERWVGAFGLAAVWLPLLAAALVFIVFDAAIARSARDR